MTTDFLNLAQKIVGQAQKLGAEASEAYVQLARELTIEVREQEVDTLKSAENRGIGLRVFKNNRIGFAYSSDLSKTSLEELVKQALANAEKTAEDRYHRLPGVADSYPNLDMFDPRIEQAELQDKIAFAKKIEQVARDYDPRVKITERSAYQDSVYSIALVNSQGIAATYRGAYCGGYAYLVAQDKEDNQTGFSMQYSLKLDELNPDKIGREAAEKAVRALGARTINTQKAVVVLDPYVATNFLGLLAPALSAESVQKGKSLLAGKIGQKIASPLINIIDDGTIEGRLMSAPFDGEGVPTSRTELVKQGELQGYLYNTYTAAKDGTVSTGNGTRGSFKSTPEIGTTNFYFAPGTITREQLLKEVNRGLYITEVLGMHTANPISGDFSLGAAGLWIENGEFTHPVRGVAIAGNIIEFLEAVDGVADDLTFFVGRGAPTIRIARMAISGS